MAPRLGALRVSDDGVTLNVDGQGRHFSWTWLRDHARDPASYHPGAHQRLVPADVVAATGRGDAEVAAGSDALVVTWPEVTAEFDADVLASVGSPAEMYGEVGLAPQPWPGAQGEWRTVLGGDSG